VSEFLGEFLDRAVHDGGSLGVVADQHLVQRLLADRLRRQIAERILAGLAQRLAPAVEDLPESPLGGAIAEEALLVLQLHIEAVDVDRRQTGGAVTGNARGGDGVFGHGLPLPGVEAGDNGWGTF
jgi:hypothetical protein